MAPRAIWKGVLKLAEVSCPVSLFTATSTSERIAFHTLNRKTGHRVHRLFVDAETEKPVETADQVKGYETDHGGYVVFEPDEIAAVLPDSDKTLMVQGFVACGAIDEIYFDRPYYVSPSTPAAMEAFALLREGMRSQQAAALARAVLFRRMRTVLVRPHGDGLIATTLNFDYEVRSAADAFDGIKTIKIEGEMLDLARHIIKTKTGKFDPQAFDDRYEAALAELVTAKIEGRKITPPKPQAATKVTNLMDMLRRSAEGGAASGKSAGKAKPPVKRKPHKAA